MTETAADIGTLQTDLRAGVLRLVLNRPQRRNSLDRQLGMALLSALQAGARDAGVRAIVVTGTGSAFCAGDDIASLDAVFNGQTGEEPSIPGTGDALYLRIAETIIHCPKPVIAALNGDAVGAGSEIACAADLRIATDSARIGSGLVHIGQFGSAALLPRIVGISHATELYLSGRLATSAEALRIGLVHEVVADAQFADRVDELAQDLASRATKAIGLFKQARERAIGQPVEFALRLQDAYHLRCMTEVEDAIEGARAFLERRAPRFSGR